MNLQADSALVAVVADIDGTLASRETDVAPSLIRLSDFCRDRGWKFIVATSRPPHAVPTPTQLDGCSAGLFFDGGLVAIPNEAGLWEPSHEFPLDESDAQRASEVLRHAGASPLLLLGAAADFDVVCDPAYLGSESCQLLRSRYLLGRRLRPSTAWSFADVRSVSCFVRRRQLEDLTKAVSTSGLSASSLVRSYMETRGSEDYGWVEVSSAITKADAVAHVLASFDWRSVFLIGLGNGENDLGLLEMSDLSLCPADAVEDVRRAATVVGSAPGGTEFVAEVLQILESRKP